MWILIVLGVLLLLLLAGVLYVRSVMKGHMTPRTPEEKHFAGGGKRALVLYHPTRHGSADRFAAQIAEGLAKRGYDVTVNYASEELPYHPDHFELLVFGTGAYMNQGAVPVRRWLRNHPFTHKQVILFSVGRSMSNDVEIEQMKFELGRGNIIYQIKVSREQEEIMADFLERVELDNPDFDALPDEEDEEDWEEAEQDAGEEEWQNSDGKEESGADGEENSGQSGQDRD